MVVLTRGRERKISLAKETQGVEEVQQHGSGSRQNGTVEVEGAAREDDDSESASSDTSESDDDSDEDSDEESDDDSDEDSDRDNDEELDALFAKSVEVLKKRDSAAKTLGGGPQSSFEDNADVITLGLEDDVAASKGKQDTSAGGTRKGALKKRQSSDKTAERQLESAFDRLRHGAELGDAQPKTLRQQQRERREQRAKTAGPGWFDMPAFPGSSSSSSKPTDARSLTKPNGSSGDARGPTAEAMRREIQAIRLRNAIDPKRFYRGGAANDTAMPKYAQLGRVISSHTQPAATLNRGERAKTVIEELVKDAETAAYAKRKFGEQQEKTNVGWSSHVRRYPKGGKKQRR